MSPSAQTTRPSASLQRHLMWLLLGVVGIFGAGIGLSLWFSLQSTREEQLRLIGYEAEQAQANLVRRLEYYRTLADNAARDRELVDALAFGSPEAQQAWARTRQHLLPEILGLALVDARGEVVGDAASFRVGPECQRALRRPGALTDG